VLHWQLRHKNANDEEIRSVAGKAAKSMKDGEVLFWDRLGRSGKESCQAALQPNDHFRV